MAVIVEHRKYVLTDATDNHNKYWEYTLHDDNTCYFKWGRIGKTYQELTKQVTRKSLDTVIREKEKKGYRKLDVVSNAPESQSKEKLSTAQLKEVVKQELAGSNPILQKLVTRLAEANKHELIKASGGKIDIDLSTGIISTPLGVVTQDNIDKARTILTNVLPFVQTQNFEDKKFVENINDYLMLVPQEVHHKRGWHKIFITNDAALQKQNSLLDQMESSINLVKQRMDDAARNAAAAKGGVVPPSSQVFSVKLNVLDDGKIIDEIAKFYKDNINASHSSSRLKPVNFYELELANMKREFDTHSSKMSNIWRLWHGSRAFNILSIMKSGLIMPKSNGISLHITGAMFGSGIYFSDQSTKSLNYSHGYWDGGSRDNNCFMFLADVAMGNYYVPPGTTSSLPPKGYDSYFAKAGKSGVMNHEMVVFRTNQINLRYLIEFSDR